ncbi:MAG TPA: carboxypeptidase regulatory-like domain-containing protein [Candidatus Tectomicrobia bacterium]|nr:carboxypeptidase regulatory-like domain-containing protein [Candidatus Tectomicrobia bacterium]
MMKRWPTGSLILPMLGILMLPLQALSYEATTVSDGGTIVGEIKYAGDPPPPQKIEVTKDTNICGTEPKVSPVLVVGADKGIRDVVAFLPGIQKGKALEKPAKPPVLDQKNCEYHPYAQIFPVGTSLQILNSDAVLHNVKTKAGSKTTFNVAQPKIKPKLTQEFKNPEIVQVECNVHGWMTAILVVAEHPYYALTDANGSFKITDVPPGKHTLKVWHAKLGEQTKEVTVNPKEETKVAFEMKSP